MKLDIVTVGSGVVDMFLGTDLEESGGKMCVPIGDKIIVKNCGFSTGGGGTNAAVSFSRLGMKTGFIGKLGKDENASLILNELKNEKVLFLGKQGNELTGFSAVIDSVKLNRTILTFKGANDNLKFKDVHLSGLHTNWFYFSSMLNESFKTQEKLASYAFKKKIKIAYNPSIYVTKLGAAKLHGILKFTDILILNDEEAADLVGSADAFRKLHKLGPRIVCVTHGDKGNSVSNGDFVYTAIAHKVGVVEKTGAGDAFGSGFVAGMIKFSDVEKAMQYGSLNAESVIQKYGAKNGLLSSGEIEKRIKKKPVKIIRSNYSEF